MKPGPAKSNVGKCIVDGCDREQLVMHMCGRHYQRQHKRGTLELKNPLYGRSAVERTRARSIVTAGGCWEFQGCKTWQGYGHIRDGKKMRLTHIVMWEDRNGPKPEGMSLDHLCRNRACCNPDHFELVTHAENVRRGVAGLVAKMNLKQDPATGKFVTWRKKDQLQRNERDPK